jgi:hypothetical protein
MTDMSCTYAGNRDEILVAYLYGDIEPSDRSAFESHLTTCSTCRNELNELGAVRRQLSRWAPPELQTTMRAPSSVASPPGVNARRWWDDVPAWAQVAAAMLVLGATAGVANLSVHYDRDGFSIQTGWMRPAPVRPGGTEATIQGATAQAPWRADLTSLEQQLRAELRPASATGTASPVASVNDAELLRKVRALISESEKREQTELALRIGQVSHDVQTQRITDLTNIDRNLRGIQSTTGIAVAQQNQYINSLVRVSQTSQTPSRQH